MKVAESEIDALCAEIVDLLLKPAGEFVPRLKGALLVFSGRVLQRMEAFDDEPTEPQRPKIKPKPRAHQATMDIRLEDIIELKELRKPKR